jgi:hypothetical protein
MDAALDRPRRERVPRVIEPSMLDASGAERERPLAVAEPPRRRCSRRGASGKKRRVDPDRHRVERLENDAPQRHGAHASGVFVALLELAASETASDVQEARLSVDVGAMEAEQSRRRPRESPEAFASPPLGGRDAC